MLTTITYSNTETSLHKTTSAPTRTVHTTSASILASVHNNSHGLIYKPLSKSSGKLNTVYMTAMDYMHRLGTKISQTELVQMKTKTLH